MGAQLSQAYPPKPTFTVADIEPQAGKVFVVTGGTSGIGLEVAKVLFQKRGKVYITGRSIEQAVDAINSIQASASDGGSVQFLPLYLEDLSSIKGTVDEFMSKEAKLDVLFNNAGISMPPEDSISVQGYELQFATNCLGPFLLTQLLLPALKAASASSSHPARVIWASSQIMELSAPQHGIIMEELRHPPQDRTRNYVNSKTGNWFLSTEMARRLGPSLSIISIAQNPGAASTNLFRHAQWMKYVAWPMLHNPKLAGLTLLYSAFSMDLTLENNGSYVIPWGRVSKSLRKDLQEGAKSRDDGGSGRAEEFWEFCLEKVRSYM